MRGERRYDLEDRYDRDLRFAQAARKRLIERLKVCNCRFPIVRQRTGSGHLSDCPAHALWLTGGKEASDG